MSLKIKPAVPIGKGIVHECAGMIIGVAIKYNDLVICLPKPNRHHDLFIYMKDTLNLKPPLYEGEQGFYLSDGTFLGRTEARKHAISTHQVISTKHESHLFSEDLW